MSIQNSIARLGRSLDANQKDAVQIKVSVANLRSYAHQARTQFDEDGLNELAESIKALGILQPLVVRPGDVQGTYEIVAGERRWRAAKIAGLQEVPVLVKTLSEEMIDEIHMDENVHRENLSNLDLSRRVQEDLDKVNGDLALVATKYKKPKSWVSLMSSMARGGAVMMNLVEANVTADREVLATVSSLERSDPLAAVALVKELKQPDAVYKRAVSQQFMRDRKQEAKSKAGAKVKGVAKERTPAKEPVWREQVAVSVSHGKQPFIGLEMSPSSDYVDEFTALTREHGDPHLATGYRHELARYALVAFGPGEGVLRAYKAEDLRLTCVDVSK